MNQSLLQLAKRAAADERLIAFLVEKQAKRENVGWVQLAAILDIEPVQLARLALCQQPRELFFTQDVAQIVGYSGINRVVLLHFMDCASRGVPMKQRMMQPAKPTSSGSTKRNGSIFMLNRRTWAFGLATLLVLILGAFVLAQPNGTGATLVVSAGEVVVNQAGGAIFAGRAETAVSAGNVVSVAEGDTIRLGSNAAAQLRLQDGSTVDLFGDTTLAVTELLTNEESYRVRLSLVAGKTLNRVVRLLKPGDTFEIKTPSSTASVRGTVFTVEVQSAEASYVMVEEGVVRVTMADQSVDVQQGYEVTAVVGQPLQVIPVNAQPVPNPASTPTNTPKPEAEPTATSTETAVPSEASSETEEEDLESGPPSQVPGNPPVEVPGDGNPPEGGATPPGHTDSDDVDDSDDSDNTDVPDTEKVVICHYSSENADNPVTLEISIDSLAAHLAHGDQLGACPVPPAAAGDDNDNDNPGNSGNDNPGNSGGNSGNNGNGGGKP